jgi:ribosomal protein L12E/L44/L45/RPP1/RPP2
MQGWVGAEPDSLWKTFSALSQKDIDEMKEHFKEQQQAQTTEAQQPDRAAEPNQVN